MTANDLFCGIGGFHQACRENNINVIFASDIDKYAASEYERNYHLKPHGDITKIKSEHIPDHDILLGGFPCQSFSIAGKRKGFEDTRGTLFFEIARILQDKKPKYFLLENVKGLLSHDKGNTFKIIENTLLQLGYFVKAKVLNAKFYGVPQNRERVFIIGFQNIDEYFNFKFPDPVEKPIPCIKDILEPEENIDEKYYIDNNPNYIKRLNKDIFNNKFSSVNPEIAQNN